MEYLKQWCNIASQGRHSLREWNSKDQKWWHRPINEPLADALIQEHLTRSDDCRAIWLNVSTEAGPDKLDHSRFMNFDFDDRNEQLTTDEIQAYVARVANALTADEAPHRMFCPVAVMECTSGSRSTYQSVWT